MGTDVGGAVVVVVGGGGGGVVVVGKNCKTVIRYKTQPSYIAVYRLKKMSDFCREEKMH